MSPRAAGRFVKTMAGRVVVNIIKGVTAGSGKMANDILMDVAGEGTRGDDIFLCTAPVPVKTANNILAGAAGITSC